jgi:pyridoxal phosphate enzyme (YggS family)
MLAENFDFVKRDIPGHVKLIAVSKTHPAETVREAYDLGQRVFGENKVQELVSKAEQLPSDIEWHMIGHMQSNKIKYISRFVSLIHGVDSEGLLHKINSEGRKINRVIPCLLQVYIAEEETKFGFSPEELRILHGEGVTSELPFVEICGLMGMATFTDDFNQVRKEFRLLYSLFTELKAGYYKDKPSFREISMGMSNDYKIAIEEGSTMVRIGSALFGDRNYSK